jgi:2,5-diketo-D-gluconate reductase A
MLKLDFVDLYLIHNPKGKNCIATWKGMLEVKRLGLAKAVGVSNFGRWR